MAIWYLNMIEENKRLIEDAVGMKVFQYINHQFWGDGNGNVKQMLVEVEIVGVFDSMKIICG